MDVLKKKGNLLFLLFYGLLFSSMLHAGTTDTLGLSGAWTTFSGYMTDGYVQKFVGFMLLIVGIGLLLGQKYVFGAIVLAIMVFYMNIATITGKVASATF